MIGVAIFAIAVRAFLILLKNLCIAISPFVEIGSENGEPPESVLSLFRPLYLILPYLEEFVNCQNNQILMKI